MKFKEAYRAFHPSGGKRCTLKRKTETERETLINTSLNYESIKNYDSYAGFLADGYILVDLDNKIIKDEVDILTGEIKKVETHDPNKTESKKLIEILAQAGIDTPILETDHGHHFIFKVGAYDNKLKSTGGVLTPIGFKVDYKLGRNYDYECIKLNGVERTIINDTSNIADIPLWLVANNILEKKIKTIIETQGINGRNDSLISYKYLLFKAGYEKTIIDFILDVINEYLFYEPLPVKEMDTIKREENIEPNEEINVNKEAKPFLYPNKNGVLTVSTEKLAQYIINKYDFISLNGVPAYNNGICYKYTPKRKDIEKLMYKEYKAISVNKLNEAVNKFQWELEEKEEDKNYIALKNGLFNFNSFLLEPPNKNIIVARYIDVEYKPETKTFEVLNYLNDLVQGDLETIEVIKKHLGHAIYSKNIAQRVLLIKGNRGNGKTQFFKILEIFFGKENSSSLKLVEFNEKFKMIETVGKMVNFGDDISGQPLPETDTFKSVTGGGSIMVEEKGKQPVNYQDIKLDCFFNCNKLPKISDPQGAVLRRLNIIEFNNNFSMEKGNNDPYIVEKMTSKENLEAWLLLALDGLKQVIKDKGIARTAKTLEILEEYHKSNNPILDFIDEKLGDSPEKVVNFLMDKTTREIYMEYDIYCSFSNMKPLTQRNFTNEILNIYPDLAVRKTNGLRKYTKNYKNR